MRRFQPTLSDVAKQAGVSKVAASAVLNGSCQNTRVSDDTRRRIEEVAKALNYHPNGVARALTRRTTDTIGVLFGRVRSTVVSNPYAGAILDGILSRCSADGLDVHLFTREWVDARTSSSAIHNHRTDGIIVVQPLLNSDVVKTLNSFEIPLVVVAWDPQVVDVPTVDVDNGAAIKLAVDHLWSLGHRRIAHLAGDAVYASAEGRLKGFIGQMSAMGVTDAERYVRRASYRSSGVEEAFEDLMKQPEPPTAIVCANDAIALAAMSLAARMGIDVPSQLSITGLNDIAQSSSASPGLTTVREPLNEMGRQAAESLIALIHGQEVKEERHVRITPELVVRGSTAPPNQMSGGATTLSGPITRRKGATKGPKTVP